MARILVIDDEAPIRNIIGLTLRKQSHEIIEAPNGKVGIECQRQNPADIVITDIIMPEQDGIETIMNLRKAFPQTKIIAMSGGGRIGPGSYLEMAKKMGAHHVLEKPLDRKELSAIIHKLLESPSEGR